MEITLEKIELVKDRTGVSYKEAKEALEAADGSVVDAIIAIEEGIDEKTKGTFTEAGARIVERIKEAVRKGNVSRILIKKDEEVLLNLPVNIGIIGTLLAPWGVVVGVIAAFGTKCVIELVRDDGSIYDISEMASETFDGIVEKGSVIVDEVKEKGGGVYRNVREKASEAMSKVKKDDGADDTDFDFDFSDDDYAGAGDEHSGWETDRTEAADNENR